MKVEPFEERELSILFDLLQIYYTYFDPENPRVYTEDNREYFFIRYDLTDHTKDILVLTEENIVHGIVGLLRSSSSKNWEIEFAVAPNSVSRHQIIMLFEEIVRLVRKKITGEEKFSGDISMIAPSIYTTLNEVVQSKGFSPIEYRVDLFVDFNKYQYSPILPEHIVIQPQKDVREGEEFIRLYNNSFVNHFGFEPLTLEDPFRDFINQSIEKGEAQLLYAYLENKIIGFLLLTFRSYQKAGKLVILGVDPQYQKKGIGTSLLHQGIKYLQDLGRQPIILSGVFYSNPKALNLYLRLGCYKKPHSEFTIYNLKSVRK